MDERDAVARLIERLVREAGLWRAADREDLRRELESHFAPACGSPEALRAALERFGSPDDVARGLRRAHRRGWLAWYVAKVAASLLVGAVAGLAIQLLATLYLGHDDTFRVPALLRLGGAALAIALIAVALWELGVEALCQRLERRPLRLLVTAAALGTGVYLAHQVITPAVPPGQAVVLGGMLALNWVATLAILARLDLIFLRFLTR